MIRSFSKEIIRTNDQVELPGTKETIRKDRTLLKLVRLRWEKSLKNELDRLDTEKSLLEKEYSFERHLYERKFKSLNGKKRLPKMKNLTGVKHTNTKENVKLKDENQDALPLKKVFCSRQ